MKALMKLRKVKDKSQNISWRPQWTYCSSFIISDIPSLCCFYLMFITQHCINLDIIIQTAALAPLTLDAGQADKNVSPWQLLLSPQLLRRRVCAPGRSADARENLFTHANRAYTSIKTGIVLLQQPASGVDRSLLIYSVYAVGLVKRKQRLCVCVCCCKWC